MIKYSDNPKNEIKYFSSNSSEIHKYLRKICAGGYYNYSQRCDTLSIAPGGRLQLQEKKIFNLTKTSYGQLLRILGISPKIESKLKTSTMICVINEILSNMYTNIIHCRAIEDKKIIGITSSNGALIGDLTMEEILNSLESSSSIELACAVIQDLTGAFFYSFKCNKEKEYIPCVELLVSDDLVCSVGLVGAILAPGAAIMFRELFRKPQREVVSNLGISGAIINSILELQPIIEDYTKLYPEFLSAKISNTMRDFIQLKSNKYAREVVDDKYCRNTVSEMFASLIPLRKSLELFDKRRISIFGGELFKLWESEKV